LQSGNAHSFYPNTLLNMAAARATKKSTTTRPYLKAMGWLHLWLGLIVGSVIVVISLSAAVFVFEAELTDLFYSQTVKVEPQKTIQPMSEMVAAARKAVEGRPIIFADIPQGPDRAWIFIAKKYDPTRPGYFYFSEYESWHKVYVNPYTARVTGVLDMRYEPIYLFRVMHQQLLLRYTVGHMIVAVSTLIFIVMIISGLVLWFPRNKQAIKQRFRIKWNASFKRLNHDIHNVGGFYFQPVLLILIITGLFWSFRWWQAGIDWVLGVSDRPQISIPKPPVLPTHNQQQMHALNNAWTDFEKRYAHRNPSETSIILRDTTQILIFAFYREDGATPKTDNVLYDAVQGKPFFIMPDSDLHIGQKWKALNYSIHVGSIYGMPTKILAFLASLFSASLPVTGFLIWQGRRRKNTKAVKSRQAVNQVRSIT